MLYGFLSDFPVWNYGEKREVIIRENSGTRNFRWLNLIFWIIFLILLYNILFGNNSCYRRSKLKRRIELLRDSIEQLRLANDSLTVEEKRMLYDYQYLEKIAREKLGMVKKGEKVYRYLNEDSIDTNETQKQDGGNLE